MDDHGKSEIDYEIQYLEENNDGIQPKAAGTGHR